ncbi:hypothetical protein PCE1_002828 [Barthelona sp. PCE]
MVRVTLRRRTSYNTKSQKTRVVKTPGGRLVTRYLKKKTSAPRCGFCSSKLQGIPRVHPKEMHRLSKNQRTVSRAYGGNLCHKCVRDRVLRAFLAEERQAVKKSMKE